MYSFFTALRNIFIVTLFLIITSCISVPFKSYNFQTNIRESFVKIIGLTPEGTYSGSGVVIDHLANSHSIIITAGHICKENNLEMTVLDYLENDYIVLYMAISADDDLCAIITEKLVPVKPASIALFAPNIGDKIFNIAAPMGIHAKNMSLMFDGYYTGDITVKTDKYALSVYTTPAMGGSSGSPIFNQNWEVIGIISRAYPQFENAAFAVSQVRVAAFSRAAINAAKKNLKLTFKDKLNQFLSDACQETHFCKT